jgi:hypothetical protein
VDSPFAFPRKPFFIPKKTLLYVGEMRGWNQFDERCSSGIVITFCGHLDLRIAKKSPEPMNKIVMKRKALIETREGDENRSLARPSRTSPTSNEVSRFQAC